MSHDDGNKKKFRTSTFLSSPQVTIRLTTTLRFLVYRDGARQQCRLTICIELDELTNSIRQQDPNIYSDTEARCLVYIIIAIIKCQQHHNDNIGSVIFTILIIFMFSRCKSLSNGEWHTQEYSGQKNLVGGNMER